MKKLLLRTQRFYSINLTLVLLISTPIFFLFIKKLYVIDADEDLILHRKEFVLETMSSLTIDEIDEWNKYNRNIKITEDRGIQSDTLFYTKYYEVLEDENEPYRELWSPITIEGKPYTFQAKINLVEDEDILMEVFVLLMIIFIMINVGNYLITKRLSTTLWAPFYQTLASIKRFDIQKLKELSFDKTDIYEFHTLNEQLLAMTRNSISIYKSQKEFVENAAHELQTPIAVFKAKLDELIQGEDLTAQQAEIVNVIAENTSRLSRLNANLLLLSKIDQQVEIVKEKVTLNEVIKDLLFFYEYQLGSKKMQLELNLEDNISIEGNKGWVEILLSNLVSNAIKYADECTVLKINLTSTTFSIGNQSKRTALQSNRLFQRFSKFDTSEKGTGLGLAICKKIVDQLQWKINYTYENNYHIFSVNFELDQKF